MKSFCAGSLSTLFAFILLLAYSPNATAGQYLYGVSDDNKIHQIDLTNHSDSVVFDTGLTGLTNGVAWDEAAGRLYYRNPENGSLYYWAPATNLQSALSGESLPGFNANAAVYNSAYWYVEEGTDTLVRATFDASGPAKIPVLALPTEYFNFDGTGATSFIFGDISIDKNGVLYGSSNYGLFSVNISGAFPTQFKILSPSYGVRQIAVDPSGKFFYAQDHATGNWYTATLDGQETPVYSSGKTPFSTTPLRDIGEVIGLATVPEPAAWQLLLAGAACITFARVRIRKA